MLTYDVSDILSLSRLACFYDFQHDRQWKLSTTLIEAPTILLCILWSQAYYLLGYKIISWCSMYRLLQTYCIAFPFFRFRLLVCPCSMHSSFGMNTQNLNFKRWHFQSKFVTRFINPVENSSIFFNFFIIYKMFIVKKINYKK